MPDYGGNSAKGVCAGRRIGYPLAWKGGAVASTRVTNKEFVMRSIWCGGGAKGGRSLIGPGPGRIPSGSHSCGWPVSAYINDQKKIPPRGPSERLFDVGSGAPAADAGRGAGG